MQKNITLPIRVADRLLLFPDSTTVQNDTLHIAGQDLASLAAEYGTPLYIYDRLTMDAAVSGVPICPEEILSRPGADHLCRQSLPLQSRRRLDSDA